MLLDFRTSIWYLFMILISFGNIYLWIHYFRWTFQGYLSGLYTIVCALRSIFPRVDLERVVLIDSFPSSIFLGRSLATIAEVAFAIQVADFFGCPMIVYLILVAQCFCWLSVLTLVPLFHIIEESLWALSTIVLMKIENIYYTLPYVLYMILVDIPMYIQKFKQWDGRYLYLREGLHNSILVRFPKRTWDYWKDEFLWMTLYFSIGVWASQYMMIFN